MLMERVLVEVLVLMLMELDRRADLKLVEMDLPVVDLLMARPFPCQTFLARTTTTFLAGRRWQARIMLLMIMNWKVLELMKDYYALKE